MLKQGIWGLQKRKDEIIDGAFVLACALVAIALPFSIRFTSFAIVLLVTCWIVQNNFKRLILSIRTNRILWLYCIPYLLLVVSLLYTQRLKEGLWELEKAVPLIAFPLIFSSAKQLAKKDIHFILRAFILSNVAFGIICLSYATYQYWANSVNLFFNFDLVMIFHSHPTYYSMYILFCLTTLLYFNLDDEEDKGWDRNKFVVGAIVLFFTAIIFLLAVRFIFVQFILFGGVVIYLYIQRSKRILTGILLLISFVTIVGFAVATNKVLQERLMQLVESHTYTLSANTMEGYNGLTTRLAQWEVSWTIIKEAPVWGVGPADVQHKLQVAYKNNFLKYSYRDKLNAHNQYVQTCLGLGFIGLLFFIANLAVPGILAIRQKKIVHFAFLLIFAVGCVTESMLYVQKGIVFFALFNSLFTFHLLQPNPEHDKII